MTALDKILSCLSLVTTESSACCDDGKNSCMSNVGHTCRVSLMSTAYASCVRFFSSNADVPSQLKSTSSAPSANHLAVINRDESSSPPVTTHCSETAVAAAAETAQKENPGICGTALKSPRARRTDAPADPRNWPACPP
jgi:hypothetical protein